MLSPEVSRRYARALFLSLKERRLIEEAHRQLEALKEVVERDRSLLSLLSGPRISVDEKTTLVRSVFTKRLPELLVEFLVVLIRKRRINYLPGIIDELTRLVEWEKGISRAVVIAASPVAPADAEALVRKLEARTGNTILVESKVDPSILGGMIVMLDHEVIDGSVRRSLNDLKEQLTRLRVH
ncbi:MAG TPA: ATP synthase F1 subunit delta [Acidobacteriota bacterium]|nr:ATP synthase F1 subunit delta [Acidobacteriota bacterium]